MKIQFPFTVNRPNILTDMYNKTCVWTYDLKYSNWFYTWFKYEIHGCLILSIVSIESMVQPKSNNNTSVWFYNKCKLRHIKRNILKDNKLDIFTP